MPTYSCWADANLLTPEVKERVSTAITQIHHEVAIAPRYFVQVVFNELASNSIYIAGKPADKSHIWIRADIRAGRTAEQKIELLARVVGEVSEIVGTTAEEVWVYISDIPGPSVAEYGHALPEPGQEEQWFASLPVTLQATLRPLA